MVNSLDRLLEAAEKDNRHEQAFFRALLVAMVYAHIPVNDRLDDGRIRFIQFNRPDNGQLVLPFFTDEKRSRIAEGTSARSVALSGRKLFELTLGATLMMNPNEHRCVLYPEEIETLLRTGDIAKISLFTPEEKRELGVGAPVDAPPAWLLEALVSTAATLPYVERIYLAAIYDTSGEPRQKNFLLALCALDGRGERAMHAINNALQLLCRAHGGPGLDLTYFETSGQAPVWIEELSLKPCYNRSRGA
jgi:hypothetical protein